MPAGLHARIVIRERLLSNDATIDIHSQNFLMKKSIGTRILISILASCFSCCALADTEADVIKSMSYNPKIKLLHKLAAFDGLLLGFDGGEWGGALIFLDKQGRATKVYDSNVKGIVTAGHQILVFSGLAHMGGNEGKIVELNQVANDPPSARELVTLEGEPSAVRQVDEQAVAFQVFTGFDRDGKMTYACKSFVNGFVSNLIGCATADN